MQIIEKALMPDGTRIQLENWSESYPGLPYFWWEVSAYPPEYVNGRLSRRKFRLGISLETESEARECYESLLSGKKQFAEYRKHFWYREKDEERLGLRMITNGEDI